MGYYSTFDIEDMTPYNRETEFHFYASNGANGKLNYEIDMGKKWLLKEVRVHCSSAFASTEYLVAQLSSANGSAYNMQ